MTGQLSPSDTQAAEETVRAVYRAFTSGDPDAVTRMASECFADDISIHEAESLPWGGVYEGIATAAAMAKGICSPESPILARELTLVQLISSGPDGDGAHQVVAVTEFPWRGPRTTIPMRALEWFTVSAGRVSRIQVFLWDTAAAIDALEDSGGERT